MVALIKRSLVVFDELQQGVKDVQFLADPTAGELRIGASIAVAAGFVSCIIDRLSRQHARMAFDVLATDSATAYRALIDRQVDLLVQHIIEPIPDHQMDIDVLLDDPHVVVASPQNPWTRRRRVALRDLVNESWTLPAPEAPYGSVVSEAFRASGLDVPKTVVTSTLPVRSTLLSTGRYLSMVPNVVLQFPGKDHAFKALPIALPTTLRPLAIITLKNRTLNPVAQLFRDCAHETAKTVKKKY